jgi:hypothetical protein
MKIPVLCVSALLAGAVTASSTTVIPPTFDELISRAQIIFQGEVVDRRSEWETTAQGRSIITRVTFRVATVLKGRAAAAIQLSFLGGTIGDETLTVSDMPRFLVGDRDVLFVSPELHAVSPLVGFAHGRYRIVRNAVTGADEVRTHDGQAIVIAQGTASMRLGGVLPAPGALALTEFQSLVRQKVSALKQP